MPWSSDENRDWLLSHITEHDNVLDVGAGAGVWADLLKDKVNTIDAVEIFEPYIERFGLESKYGHIYKGDFKDLAIPTDFYSVVILGDVLEHFEIDDALKVWDKARMIAGWGGQVLLSTPIVDWPQGKEEGNIHEAHLSFFDMDALLNLEGVVEVREGELIGSVLAEGKAPPLAEDLSVVIPTIESRKDRLEIAYRSVVAQTLQPNYVIVETDREGLGAPGNRDNGLAKVRTEFVAMLDDDDFFYPDHLETLYNALKENDADIVFSWFDVVGGTDPFPQNFGKEWDPENPIQTTVTILAKTQVLRDAGGYSNNANMTEDELAQFAQGNTVGEDFRMICNANANGAKIVHVPKKTWAYVHHSSNTSGRPDRVTS